MMTDDDILNSTTCSFNQSLLLSSLIEGSAFNYMKIIHIYSCFQYRWIMYTCSTSTKLPVPSNICI